ncbi:MAG: hypothetical protein N3H30_03070 [Candidatus Micrarchaeota archaeon]|nr:hypothetical protein [Candidatus Micrarchaeota archaeon]
MANARRAQAAMEYLMTYGWAILFIVIVLGVLVYLQVFNPQSKLQDQCSLPVGWQCTVASLSTNGKLTLKIANQQAVPVKVMVSCKSGTGTQITDELFPEGLNFVQLSPGQQATFTCTLTDFTNRQIGDPASGQVFLKYDDGSGTNKYLGGTFMAKASTLAQD